jgi:hypothetical protein
MAMKVDPKEIQSVQVLTPRLQKLKAEWEAAEPQVYVDDTLLFTESWKETEGLPIDIRWAKALEKRLLECPLLIRDDEIIVGSLTKFIRGNGTLCAMKPHEILEMCNAGRFDRKTSDIDSTKITPEDLAALKADAEYWIEHMPKVSTVNKALEYDMGADVFDLLFDRACVFEGRLRRRRGAGFRQVHRQRLKLCYRPVQEGKRAHDAGGRQRALSRLGPIPQKILAAGSLHHLLRVVYQVRAAACGSGQGDGCKGDAPRACQ